MPNHLEQADKAPQATSTSHGELYKSLAASAYEPKQFNGSTKPANTETENPAEATSQKPTKEQEASWDRSAAEKAKADAAQGPKDKVVPPTGDSAAKQESPSEWWNNKHGVTAALERMRPIAEAVMVAETARAMGSNKEINTFATQSLSKLGLPNLLISEDLSKAIKTDKP